MQRPPHSLEDLARLRASIEKRGDRESVLREEGLSGREWMRLQRHWLGAIATEIAAGRHELSTRYLAAFFSSPHVAAMPIEALPLPVTSAAPLLPSFLANRSILRDAVLDGANIHRAMTTNSDLRDASQRGVRRTDAERGRAEDFQPVAQGRSEGSGVRRSMP